MTQETSAPDTASGAADVFDAVSPNASRFGLGFWVIVATIGGGFPSLYAMGMPQALAAPAGVMGFYLLLWARNRLAARSIARRVFSDESPAETAAEAARWLAGHQSVDLRLAAQVFARRAALRAVARRLVAAGQTARTFRFLFPGEEAPPVPAPFQATLEPSPLQRRPEALRELTGAAPISRAQEARRGLDSLFGSLMRTRRSRRLMYILIVSGWLTLGAIAIQGVLRLFGGAAPVGCDAFSAALLAMLAIGVWRTATPEQWLTINGALLVRTTTWASESWTLHMFERGASTLVHAPSIGLLAVANQDGQAYCTAVHPLAAEVAIRAFRSPIAPPPLERMSDLL